MTQSRNYQPNITHQWQVCRVPSERHDLFKGRSIEIQRHIDQQLRAPSPALMKGAEEQRSDTMLHRQNDHRHRYLNRTPIQEAWEEAKSGNSLHCPQTIKAQRIYRTLKTVYGEEPHNVPIHLESTKMVVYAVP